MKLSEALAIDAEFWAAPAQVHFLDEVGTTMANQVDAVVVNYMDDNLGPFIAAPNDVLSWFSLLVAEDIKTIEELESQEAQSV